MKFPFLVYDYEQVESWKKTISKKLEENKKYWGDIFEERGFVSESFR